MTDQHAMFKADIQTHYQFSGPAITLGCAMLDEKVVPDAYINLPLKTINRHGLVAGATGTGKTKTVQLLSESFSQNGIPVLLMDLKGDLSGLARAGEESDGIKKRHEKIGLPYHPRGFPVEFLSLSQQPGIKLRATVSEFGPLLFSKILGLNDTQSGVVSLLFKYCDDHQLPLLDLKDFKKVLNYAQDEGKDAITKEYGAVPTTSARAILREIIELEQQGADQFFGEPSFDVQDLLPINSEGLGQVSIMRLIDLQTNPKLFSTFMLCLLAEVYHTFPEIGDPDKPKLVIFIDEAHLMFENASKELLQQLESIIKLIRSKGVGIFFCTQNPRDIPADVLGQLGMKVQHSLRAFTAKDRKDIKLVAENYPISDYYDTAELLTQLGIGEAAITVLDEKGRPTPLAATYLCAPRSRMGTLTDTEIQQICGHSQLVNKYSQTVDRDSAYEMLQNKLDQMTTEEAPRSQPRTSHKRSKEPPSAIETIAKSPLAKQIGRTLVREITRGIMGVFGAKRRR